MRSLLDLAGAARHPAMHAGRRRRRVRLGALTPANVDAFFTALAAGKAPGKLTVTPHVSTSVTINPWPPAVAALLALGALAWARGKKTRAARGVRWGVAGVGAGAAVLLGGALVGYQKAAAHAGPQNLAPPGGALLTEMVSGGDDYAIGAKVGDLLTVVAPPGWPPPVASGGVLALLYVTGPGGNAKAYRVAGPGAGVVRVTSPDGASSGVLRVNV